MCRNLAIMPFREIRRFLKSSPLLNTSAVLVLALGIGASTFGLAMLLAFSSLKPPGMKPMGYGTIAEETEGGGSVPISWKSLDEIRRGNRSDAELAAYSNAITTTVDINGKSESLTVAAVSKGFFSNFTSPLSGGRDFHANEEGQVGEHAIILGTSLATRLFKSPQAALDQFLTIGGTPYHVIGVAQPNFAGLFGDSVDGWVPASSVIPLELQLPPAFAKRVGPDAWKDLTTFYGIAGSARESSAKLQKSLSQSLPLHQSGKAILHVSQGLTRDPLRDAKLRKWLRLGLLLALIFTTISSLNYSLLLLARTPRCADEVLLKRALGAGTGRLATELMLGPAAVVAIALAAASVLWIGGLTWVARISPFYQQLVRGSWRAALLSSGIQAPFVCLLTLLVALIPATQLLRDSATPHLGYAVTATRRTSFFLQALVTSQVTLCIATWVLAGMIVGAVMSTVAQGLGYDPNHLAIIEAGIRPGAPVMISAIHDTFPPHAIIQSLVQDFAAMPGVRRAALANVAPFGSPMTTITVERADSPTPAPRTVNVADVSPGYFDALSATILRGRDFTWTGVAGRASEVIVNETLAKELWPKLNPVGQSVTLSQYYSSAGMNVTSTASVVGIVENMRFSRYGEFPQPTVFRSLQGAYAGFSLIVSGSEPLAALNEMASSELPARVPQLSVDDIYSITERAQASLWQIEKRAYFALAGALLMALIAYIGLYGALTFYVNTRRRELAVRVCLGALPLQIRKIVLARAARSAALAAIIAVPLWPVLAQLSSSDYLGSVSWSTPRAILLSLACIVVAILVSLIPARSAVRTSPAEVLKEL